jgi:hypothetical protein
VIHRIRRLTATLCLILPLGAITIGPGSVATADEVPERFPWVRFGHKAAEWLCHKYYGENFPSEEERTAARKACSMAQHPGAWLRRGEPEWLKRHEPEWLTTWLDKQTEPHCHKSNQYYDSEAGRCVDSILSTHRPSWWCIEPNQYYDSTQHRCVDGSLLVVRPNGWPLCSLSQRYDSIRGGCVDVGLTSQKPRMPY